MDGFWIILTAILVSTSCGILGCFLLLRKMTMVADAISHAVLPGIVIAYFVAQSRAELPMLVGAAIVGMLTTVLIELLHEKARLQSDAAIGIAFTGLFAFGVILISAYAGSVDIDQDCVLYGEIAYVPLETWVLSSGRDMGPIAVWRLMGLLTIILAVVITGFKAFKLTSFDPVYAASIGLSTVFWHYLLMSMVSLTTVLTFESVGAILVVAFIIGPAATAFLLTRQLHYMIFLSVGLGILASVCGFFLAVWVDGSIAGAISVCIGIEFLLVFVYKLVQRRRVVSDVSPVEEAF
ncbi:MAG: metal ABC transporter permease [Bacteroidota bacterium]